MASVGDQDQFFFGCLDALEIVNGGLRGTDDVVLPLDNEVGGVDVARHLRQVRGDLVGQDVLAGELHSVFKVLELFRLSSLQFGRLTAQVLQPLLIGGSPH